MWKNIATLKSRSGVKQGHSRSAKMCIRKIETVLKRFTKRIHGLGNQNYDVRLKALNEHSLESRRIRADLIMCQ